MTPSDAATFQLPPWITGNSNPDDEHYARKLSRQVKRNELVRVRRGLYLPQGTWIQMKPWEQFRMRIQAVHDAAAQPPLFTVQSSAQVWGLPLISVPNDVETIVRRTGSGGRSRNGVRRYPGDPGSMRIFRVEGLLVTSKVQTARDIAVRLPFGPALAVMDRLLCPKPLPGERRLIPIVATAEDVEALTEQLPSLTARRRVLRVLAAADSSSGSPGESLSRAVILRLGFPAPQLQHELRDSQGRIGFGDFYWPEHGLVGEFDGWVKFSRAAYLSGKLPEDVLKEEKIREDRIRATGLRVVRWMWPQVMEPAKLGALLRQAGLTPSTFSPPISSPPSQ